MRERILFLTGRLARPRLEKVLSEIEEPGFDWEVFDVGVKVAALMTGAIIQRRLQPSNTVDRIVVPGRCRADLDELSKHFNIPFERGPEELKDLSTYLGKDGKPPDLSKHNMQIFAEIVDASSLTVSEILERAKHYSKAGADVIDIGCLPDTPFPHLEKTVRTLKKAGLEVSVDSADLEELRRGGRAGADYLLSLTEETLGLTDEVTSVPILIPSRHGELSSLYRAMDLMDAKGKPYLVDPILDPIHFGFMSSLERYAKLRRKKPDANILMGTGNLTELTDADTPGITAMLLGICSELQIRNVLVVQVSPHTRRTVEEHDAARRIMHAASVDESVPKDYSDDLLCLRAKKPFVNTLEEIEQNASEIRDDNFRIETSEDGIHIYNRQGHHVAADPFALFPKLQVEQDGGHAFYLGSELARAEIAWQLGKRYAQDRPLDWGAAVDKQEEDLTTFKKAGETLKGKLKVRKDVPTEKPNK